MRYGIDIDGVLANFVKAFRHAMRLAPVPLTQRQTYDLEHPWRTYDYCKDVVGPENWKWFWNEAIPKLRVYTRAPVLGEETRWLNRLAVKNPVYLITSRSSEPAQTYEWLGINGVTANGVIIAAKPELKLGFVNALQLEAFVDDSPTTVLDMAGKTEAQLYLFDSAWSKDISPLLLRKRNILRIKSLKELL